MIRIFAKVLAYRFQLGEKDTNSAKYLTMLTGKNLIQYINLLK